MDSISLTARQEAFCQKYFSSGNATQAYKDAGYKCKTDASACSCASKLLRNAEVRERIAELAEESANTRIADAEEVQETLTAILRGQLQEQQVVTESIGYGMTQVRIVSRDPSLRDVIRAGEALSRMRGWR